MLYQCILIGHQYLSNESNRITEKGNRCKHSRQKSWCKLQGVSPDMPSKYVCHFPWLESERVSSPYDWRAWSDLTSNSRRYNEYGLHCMGSPWRISISRMRIDWQAYRCGQYWARKEISNVHFPVDAHRQHILLDILVLNQGILDPNLHPKWRYLKSGLRNIPFSSDVHLLRFLPSSSLRVNKSFEFTK